MDPDCSAEFMDEAVDAAAPDLKSDEFDVQPLQVLKLPPVRSASRKAVTRCRASLTVTSEVADAELTLELLEGEILEAFPVPLPLGETVRQLRSSGAILGQLSVSGVPPVPFGVQVEVRPSAAAVSSSTPLVSNALSRRNFVASELRTRSVAMGAEELKVSNGLNAAGEGTVVEVAVTEGHEAALTVKIRQAKKKELNKLAQQQALRLAMERGRYSSLLAQIARSKSRKVEASLIDEASRMLKTLQPKDGSFMTHKELGHLMKWSKATSPDGACEVVQPCDSSADCPCNRGYASPGELCDVINDAVTDALRGVVPSHLSADEWLFKALVKAALMAPEGCVWKSGGKFLLTNEERNQSATAIVGVLERENQETDAGKGIRALVDYTEQHYGYRVTAVQLNFHPNQKSSHKQHRDIYGAGQKGGINCTCSFMKCTGTVCYSLGSSRQVLCETITDSRSKYETCGEDCAGMKTYKWMHSGSAMHFNAPWNNNHTHGIPPMDDPCGPRISVALLCA